MPTPAADRKGPIDRGVTNIRDTSLSHWLRWLKPEIRCLVLAMSSASPPMRVNPVIGQKVWTWFALDERHPLPAVAGIWCTWTGTRGSMKNRDEGCLVASRRPHRKAWSSQCIRRRYS